MNPQREHDPVVVGIDGSETALDAVRWAACEAARRGAPLRLISALGGRADYGYGPRKSWSSIYDMVVDYPQHHLDAAVAAAAHIVAPAVDIDACMRTGHPVEVLAGQSVYAALLVVGHRGWSGLPGLLAGSVATRLAAISGCPVVVVREPVVPEPGDIHRPVVVGVDGSEVSEVAIEFAFEEADRRRAPLVAVHTWLDRVLDPSIASLLDWDVVRAEEESLLAERLAGWSEKYPNLAVRRVVRRDRPSHVLLELAEDAQLLVVGSRGRGVVAGTLLGSVSQAAIHRAPCPVAVVRTPTLEAHSGHSGGEHDAT